MSADNYLRIIKIGKKYEVREGNASTGYENPRGSSSTLEGAIKLANEFQENEIIEYGLRVSLEGEDE